jgi:hypothetical protein
MPLDISVELELLCSANMPLARHVRSPLGKPPKSGTISVIDRSSLTRPGVTVSEEAPPPKSDFSHRPVSFGYVPSLVQSGLETIVDFVNKDAAIFPLTQSTPSG